MSQLKQTIVLNYLPPGDPYLPDPGMSIIKTYLVRCGYDVIINYWVFDYQTIIKKAGLDIPTKIGEDKSLYQLFPILYLLAREVNDLPTIKKLECFLNSINHQEDIQELLHTIETETNAWINQNIELLIQQDPTLIGYTAKFNQWLSVLLISLRIKRLLPQVPSVIGGLYSVEAASEILKILEPVDFAIWGEGEISMSLLFKEICRDKHYSGIQNLLFRNGKEIIRAQSPGKTFTDLNDDLFPDYSDFFRQLDFSLFRKENIAIPIEGSRGCHWRQCQFCYLNSGFKYRCKTSNRLLREMVYLTQQYPGYGLEFVDNDFVGEDISIFEKVLESIISYNSNTSSLIRLYSVEIIHHDFSEHIIKKMALSGITQAQVGYESTSDSLLQKMKKKSDFADNILFLKFAKKYKIKITGLNIITGIPDEEDSDIIESINNLRYLRFYLDEKFLSHSLVPLSITTSSPYFPKVKATLNMVWNKNELLRFIPSYIKQTVNEYCILNMCSYYQNPLWSLFVKENDYYCRNHFSYRIVKTNSFHIEEYLNDSINQEIILDDPLYWKILTIANERIVSLQEIIQSISDLDKENESETKIVKAIAELKSAFLLFSNTNLSRIVSILDTNQVVQ